MSVPTEPGSETRRILGPAGNRVKILEEEKEALKKKKKDVVEKTPKSFTKSAKKAQQIVVTKTDKSVDSSCSSKSSSSNGSSVKIAVLKRREKNGSNRLKSKGSEAGIMKLSIPFKRCDWITQFSDPLHVSFHDEEWGVPVHEDRKLFELLVLSQASAELTWPEILYKREKFRKFFDNFDPSYIAKLSLDKLLSPSPNGSPLLSEQKLRAVVENAVQVVKIQQEFGSFSAYCWQFLNHKPIKNSFRYARQIPAKTPKSELISKDLMRRGFRCVGPTLIYSFMQVSGMVNDHLISCFRYIECNSIIKNGSKGDLEESKAETNTLKDSKLPHE